MEPKDVTASAGRCALVIPVPELEPIVSHWRDRTGHPAGRRMPAHITVMYPFLSSHELSTDVYSGLADVCGRTPPIEVTFRSLGTFPGVVYLAPSPVEEFRGLTERVVEMWPGLQPYEGAHTDVVPHLTLAYTDDAGLVHRIAEEVEPQLPISSALNQACIFELADAKWRHRFSLPFGSSGGGSSSSWPPAIDPTSP